MRSKKRAPYIIWFALSGKQKTVKKFWATSMA